MILRFVFERSRLRCRIFHVYVFCSRTIDNAPLHAGEANETESRIRDACTMIFSIHDVGLSVIIFSVGVIAAV